MNAKVGKKLTSLGLAVGAAVGFGPAILNAVRSRSAAPISGALKTGITKTVMGGIAGFGTGFAIDHVAKPLRKPVNKILKFVKM